MIKGVDSQVIIARMTDIMKQNSTINKNNENAKEFGSMMLQQQIQKNKDTVEDTQKSGGKQINDQSKKGFSQGNGQKKEEEDSIDQEELILGGENAGYSQYHRIDIEA